MSDLIKTGAESIEIEDLYSIEDIGDLSNPQELYASKEDAQHLLEEGKISQEYLINHDGAVEGTSLYDPRYSFHRSVVVGKSEFIGKTEYICWSAKPSKEEKEQGLTGEEIDPENESHRIVAVRGIVLSFNWGANLLAMHNGDWVAMCQTIGVEETLPDGRIRKEASKNNFPLKQPVERMPWGAKKPNEPSLFFKKNPHINPIAERYDLSAYKKEDKTAHKSTAVQRSCLDCVRNKEYIVPNPADPNKSFECSMSGYVLMAVFQLGYKDTTRYNEAPDENPIDIKWVDVKDAGLTDYRDQPLDRPFILRVDRLTKGLTRQKVGDGEYDLPVKLPKHYEGSNGKRKKNYFLPHNNVLTVKGLYDWFYDRSGNGSRTRMHKAGFPTYPVMVEMYSAPLMETPKFRSDKDYAPVFNVIPLDEDNCFNGVHIDHYVSTALMIARQEAMLAKGAEESINFASLPAPSKAISASKEAPAPAETSPMKSLDELANTAFSVKPKKLED